MKVKFVQEIELQARHVRVLKMLAKGRLSWNQTMLGEVLDDLTGWGLARQDNIGAELHGITRKGLEALNQALDYLLKNRVQ